MLFRRPKNRSIQFIFNIQSAKYFVNQLNELLLGKICQLCLNDIPDVTTTSDMKIICKQQQYVNIVLTLSAIELNKHDDFDDFIEISRNKFKFFCSEDSISYFLYKLNYYIKHDDFDTSEVMSFSECSSKKQEIDLFFITENFFEKSFNKT